MKRTFRGRAIIPGEWTGPCVVSRQGVNTLASFQKGALADKKTIVCSDQNNPANPWDAVRMGIYVCVPDIDAHYVQAMAAGAATEAGRSDGLTSFSSLPLSVAVFGMDGEW